MPTEIYTVNKELYFSGYYNKYEGVKWESREGKDRWMRVSASQELGLIVYFTVTDENGEYALIVMSCAGSVAYCISHEYGEYLCELYSMIDKVLAETERGFDAQAVEEFKRSTCVALSIFLTFGLNGQASSWFRPDSIDLHKIFEHTHTDLISLPGIFDTLEEILSSGRVSGLSYNSLEYECEAQCLRFIMAISEAECAAGCYETFHNRGYEVEGDRYSFYFKQGEPYLRDVERINDYPAISGIIHDYIWLRKSYKKKRAAVRQSESVKSREKPRTSSLRKVLWNSYPHTCGICGEPIQSIDEMHIDHIIPLAKGGKNTVANLQLTHACCNLKKYDNVIETVDEELECDT